MLAVESGEALDNSNEHTNHVPGDYGHLFSILLQVKALGEVGNDLRSHLQSLIFLDFRKEDLRFLLKLVVVLLEGQHIVNHDRQVGLAVLLPCSILRIHQVVQKVAKERPLTTEVFESDLLQDLEHVRLHPLWRGQRERAE